MPTSAQHAQRVITGLRFIGSPEAAAHPNELVIACFYSCLHMFEAAHFDFAPSQRARHFYTHGDRTRFLSQVRFDPKHAFFEICARYEALRGLSEQARYLSPAGSETYEPLRVPVDVNDAKLLFNDIRQHLQSVYESAGKHTPWLAAGNA